MDKSPSCTMIETQLSGIYPFIEKDELESKWMPKAYDAHMLLEKGEGPARNTTGWLRLPWELEASGLSEIKETAARINETSDILLVIGIGGSYLGAKAVIELLAPDSGGGLNRTKVIFAGTGLSGAHTQRIMKSLEGKDFSINIISKSGTTTEPSVAFRIFYGLLSERYGNKATQRVYSTTDANSGALLKLSREKGFKTFYIPGDIGGRYSVLTPVGLLPIACAGIDIDALVEGACLAGKEYSVKAPENPVWQYACARQALYDAGKKIEILSAWSPEYRYFGEWWKQLFGESEGKDLRGILPVYLEMTADLHSMGQYVQQGERMMFETFIWTETEDEGVIIPYDDENLDGLNYLAGKSVDYVNLNAMAGTKEAHMDGGVPCIELRTGVVNARCLGALLYFFQLSCAISGLIGGINPFNQPGVEAYKKNMFRLLGKT
jgi:glucose-6-phosphate isomerase